MITIKNFLTSFVGVKYKKNYFCEKNKVKWDSVPNAIKFKEKIINRYNCGQNDKVNIEIIFITDLESVTYSHYFQLSKPMIERKISKIIDRNPNLIKTLDHLPKPYKKHIIVEHWGFQHKGPNGIIYGFVPVNWMDLEPNC